MDAAQGAQNGSQSGVAGAGCWWDGGQVSQTLDAVLQKGQTMPEKNRFPAVLVPDTAHTLRGDGFDASEDGTGRGTPLVPVHCRDVAQTITSNYGKQVDNSDTALGPNIVAFDTTQDPISSTDGSPHALGCGSTGEVAICIKGAAIGRKPEAGPQYGETLVEIAYTQNCVDVHGVMTPAMQVRRLTPRECERLQGFPDDYTLIPWRGKPAELCPDGPRYKAIGNSWAVNVAAWLGARIDAAIRDLNRTQEAQAA